MMIKVHHCCTKSEIRFARSLSSLATLMKDAENFWLGEPSTSTPSAPVPDDEEHTARSTRLSCARAQSRWHGGLYDRFGIIGVVCAHRFPLLGSFCHLLGPENFVHYMVSELFGTPLLVLKGAEQTQLILHCIHCAAICQSSALVRSKD